MTLRNFQIFGIIAILIGGIGLASASAAGTNNAPASNSLPLPVNNTATASATVSKPTAPATTTAATVAATTSATAAKPIATTPTTVTTPAPAPVATASPVAAAPAPATTDSAAVYNTSETASQTVAAPISDSTPAEPEQPLTGSEKISRMAGHFHPVLLHFPIVLILMAALAEFLLSFTGRRFFESISTFSIRLGALMAVLTALAGWAAASGNSGSAETAWIVQWHRWLGTGTAAAAIVVSLVSFWINDDSNRVLYRWLLYITAVAVAVTAHFGGMIMYGVDFLKW